MEYAKLRLKRQMEEDAVSGREKIFTVVFALLLGILFDYLFYMKEIGISHIIFNCFLLSFFMWSAREKLKHKRWEDYFLLSVIFLLSINFAIHSNMFLGFLSFIGVCLLIVVYTILSTNPAADWSSIIFLTDMLERIIVKALSNIFKPFVFIRDSAAPKERVQGNRTGRNILIGIAVSIPILLFIVPLLSSADMAFDYYIRNISSLFNIRNFGSLPGHIILVSVVFLYIFGYAWSFKFSDEEKTYSTPKCGGIIDSTIIVTVLIMINIVYLLFSVVQFSYLYGGSGLPQGFTYAEYARRGFFELVAVTIINFFILIISMNLSKREKPVQARTVNISLSILAGFTFNMLFSAHYRLSLYEQSYGFTELRVYVHIFMLFMCMVFAAALFRIWNDKVPLFKVSMVCAVTIFTMLNLVNVDRIIALKNIERYRKTGKIDVPYLAGLSYDAVPEIIKLADDSNSDVAGEIREGLKNKFDALNRGGRWMEFNYSRYRAGKILEPYFGGY